MSDRNKPHNRIKTSHEARKRFSYTYELQELTGKKVIYDQFGVNQKGSISLDESGVSVINWEDGNKATIVDSEHGKLVLSDCKIV